MKKLLLLVVLVGIIFAGFGYMVKQCGGTSAGTKAILNPPSEAQYEIRAVGIPNVLYYAKKVEETPEIVTMTGYWVVGTDKKWRYFEQTLPLSRKAFGGLVITIKPK